MDSKWLGVYVCHMGCLLGDDWVVDAFVFVRVAACNPWCMGCGRYLIVRVGACLVCLCCVYECLWYLVLLCCCGSSSGYGSLYCCCGMEV